jgi:hypothetical protein
MQLTGTISISAFKTRALPMDNSLVTTTEELKPQSDKPSALGTVFGFIKRLLLFVFFGPGIIGTAWLVGKVLRRR